MNLGLEIGDHADDILGDYFGRTVAQMVLAALAG
jgi:hypothetical protein